MLKMIHTQMHGNGVLGSPPATFGRMSEDFPSSVSPRSGQGRSRVENLLTSGSLVEPSSRMVEWLTDDYTLSSDAPALVRCDYRGGRENV